MRIGVMLRTIDEKQGIGVYTQNLVDHLLLMDRENEYVLFYRNPDFLGRYAGHDNVKEKVVTAPNKLIWDQVKIPWEARRERVDVLFHTKFTVPFMTGSKTIMALHGASWFVHPELYGRLDVAYIKMVMPFYCRKASAIVSNSELTTRDFISIVGVRPDKIRTVHLAANDRFKPIRDAELLQDTRLKYGLPERFILSVVKYDPRKNFGNLIDAFRICRQQVDCKLVVVGIGCEKYREEYHLDQLGLSDDVRFLGWVEQDELPALYNLADFLFFPSVYEEFGIPVCEAMACGIPPVVSNTGALPEISGEAGTLVDPLDPNEMAQALYKLWTNESLREELSRKALVRSMEFTWEKCASETLDVIQSLANSGQKMRSNAL